MSPPRLKAWGPCSPRLLLASAEAVRLGLRAEQEPCPVVLGTGAFPGPLGPLARACQFAVTFTKHHLMWIIRASGDT